MDPNITPNQDALTSPALPIQGQGLPPEAPLQPTPPTPPIENHLAPLDQETDRLLAPEITPPVFENIPSSNVPNISPVQTPVAPESTIQADSVSKKTPSTILFVLIGLALILVGALIGILAANYIPLARDTQTVSVPTPEITPVSTTQTIESSDYSFVVQIPINWAKLNNETAFPYLFQYQTPDMSTFEVLVRELPSKVTLSQYLDNQDKISKTAYEGKPSKRILSTNETIINGLSAIEREEEFLASGLLGKVIYIPGKTKIYSLSFVPSKNSSPYLESDVYKLRNIMTDSFRLTGSESTAVLTCPSKEFVDCMPGINKSANPQCDTSYLSWAKANCPGFQGAAL